jgi:hypothetical protein
MFDWIDEKFSGILGYTFLVWMAGFFFAAAVVNYVHGNVWWAWLDIFLVIANSVGAWEHSHRKGQ